MTPHYEIVCKDKNKHEENDFKNGPAFTPVPNNGSEQNVLVSIVYSDRFAELENCLDRELNEDDNHSLNLPLFPSIPTVLASPVM